MFYLVFIFRANYGIIMFNVFLLEWLYDEKFDFIVACSESIGVM